MHVINEQEMHLKEVILDIGIRLRTSTLSESIRRSKIGPLSTQHSLVLDELTPEALIKNIDTVETIIEQSDLLDTTVLVNKTHRDETKLLGKQPDESTVDLYKTKRPTDYDWRMYPTEEPDQDSNR
jgi:hypothetical protein